MQEFEKGWPEGFRSTISKKVKNVLDSKKHIKVGSQKVYDTSVIYCRVIGIRASSRDIGIKKVLSHELAPVPTSMFHDSDAMRINLQRKIGLKEAACERSVIAMQYVQSCGKCAGWLCCPVDCPLAS